jgi:hypothetical protein
MTVPGAEPFSVSHREALIGRDDEIRLFRADRLPMIAGRDTEADVGGFEDIVEMLIDLAVQ